VVYSQMIAVEAMGCERHTMPTISMFYGIKITMNYNDHSPPHFHAEYQDFEAIIDIGAMSMTGNMPRRALNMIWAWLDKHQAELLDDWERARNRQPLKWIEPFQ